MYVLDLILVLILIDLISNLLAGEMAVFVFALFEISYKTFLGIITYWYGNDYVNF